MLHLRLDTRRLRDRIAGAAAGLLLAALMPLSVGAAESFLDPEVAFKLSARALDDKRIELRFDVAPGYHLYRDKLKVGDTVYFTTDNTDLTPDAQTRLAALLHNEDTCGRPRLIAAAQRSLAQLVREGAFRSDLFYQLNVVCIRMPPLRERREDIGDLARALLVRAKREGHAEKTLDAAAVARLQQHDFPGNIRELENLLRRAAALTPAKLITASDVADGLVVPGPVADLAVAQEFGVALARRLSGEFVNGLPPSGLYERILGEIEGPLIQQTLNATHGNQIRAAAILGINRNTLRKKIQALGITTGRGD